MFRSSLLIVIALLCFTLTGCFQDDSDQITRVKAAKVSLRTIYNAVMRYQMTVGEYPEDLIDLVYGPSDMAGPWTSLLVGGESALRDPWGNDYDMFEDNNGDIIIVCYGKDGVEGVDNSEFDVDLMYPNPRIE